MISPETKQVLAHWRKNWRKACEGTLTNGDINGDNCAYCKKYHDGDKYICIGCPIIRETGEDADKGCKGTPYILVVMMLSGIRNNECIKSAVWAELMFLIKIAGKEMRDD